ncbi:hypothetical protein BCR42DRAFT_18023 [Absidia repens]|uniref:Uncharacterized protein n=1 Tax=Absidia repens TaxID=90262 RepID=A0A1X2J2B1_9FUNG|nr:hypothetical protein BCR42DRAFT_18023 [Absidia repens]
MSLQNDLELIYLRESYMKNPSHSNMLSCMNSNTSTTSDDIQQVDHSNNFSIKWALKQWFSDKSTTHSRTNDTSQLIRSPSCQLSKPNDNLNRLVSFHL